MYDVVSLGELLIDLTPVKNSNKETFEVNPGGAPANVLACLSKLGKKTAFIGKVGDDHFGRFLSDFLKEIKIDVSNLCFSGHLKTTLAFVHLDEYGDRSFTFYRKNGADLDLSKKDIDHNIIKNSKIFHFGSLSLAGNPARTTTINAVKFAKKNGLIISFDPNYREKLWKDVNEARKFIKIGLKYTDILKISDEELELITLTKDIKKGSLYLFEKGISIVLVTLGDKGAYYRYKNGEGFLKTYKVKVADTTGAGDAFMGAILCKLSDKLPDDINNLNKNEFEDIVNFANAAGALTATKRGAIPAMPGLNEINKCIKSLKKTRESS